MQRFGLAVLLLSPAVALAHFALLSPPNWMTQAADGSPQKLGPCGNEYDGGLTGAITTFAEGQTIPVQINEIVFHPGHYRLAIAADQAALPAEPAVTGNATYQCLTAAITSPPYSLPIVADDVFDHVAAFGTPQTAMVKLPDGFTCTNCTLQIIEFMSDHQMNPVGGCFYHHCAQVTIVPADGGGTGTPDSGQGSPDSGSIGSPDSGSTGGPDSGNPGGPDAGSGNPDGGGGPGGTSTGSCGCTGGTGSASLALFGLALLGGAASRRIRRRAS